MNDSDVCAGLDLNGLTSRAIALLQENEPAEGYYLGHSGGKDSTVILALAKMAGVKFDVHHSLTTIDPPEVVRFVKSIPGIIIERPKKNMMARVAENSGGPPTRHRRWCCEEYKENGGKGRVKILGVRAAESLKRARRWKEVANALDSSTVICPIVYWSDEQVWEFIRVHELSYCSLYDEGWSRIGCIMCPLANKTKQRQEAERWPRYAANWKKAIIANWEKFHALPRLNGRPRFAAKFKTGEDFWMWWLDERRADHMREGCQSGFLWSIEDEQGSPEQEITAESIEAKYPDMKPDEDFTDYFERKAMEEIGK